jgi:pyrroloquinoline quinone biosynthesis protein D
MATWAFGAPLATSIRTGTAEDRRRTDDTVTKDDSDGVGDLTIHAAVVPRHRRVEAFGSDGESLVYSAMRDEASALNRTATEIWELCDGTRTIGAIARALGQRYGVDEADLLADVTAAVTTLRARGLVDIEFGGRGRNGAGDEAPA